MLKKITENPVLKLINNIVYVILFLIVASVLFVVILQRASNNDIALGGIRIFNIVSESMVPKYNIGDVLVVKSIEPQNIKVGDDLTRRIDEAVIKARKNEVWRSEYMKELLHDDDIREEGREAGRVQGRAEGESLLLALISRMAAGGDADKAAQLADPKVLKAMQKKYGM